MKLNIQLKIHRMASFSCIAQLISLPGLGQEGQRKIEKTAFR